MSNLKDKESYVMDWNNAVKLHRTQIGILGRISEFFIGSEFWFDLENELYNKYGLSPYEIDDFEHKLEL